VIFTPGQLNRRAELYYQLGTMIGSGVPLIQALEMASTHPGVRHSRGTIQGVLRHLKAGLPFSESLSRVEGWLPEFDVALLSVGEQSGRLDSSFRLLSLYYGSRAKVLRDTLSGMVVTLATLHVFVLVFPLSYLIQCAQGIFNGDYMQCLPFVLEKLAVFGSLYGTAFLVIYACQGQRGETWRAVVESFTDCVPLLRTARKYLALSRLSAALDATTNAGVSIIKAWDLSAAASGSPRLKRAIATWKEPLANGATFAEMVAQTSYFPSMFSNLYTTGERSGQLDQTLGRLQAYFQEEGMRTLRLFTRLLNGLIYGAVAVMVGWNIIRFWMNYYGTLLNDTSGL
jgi:type II secretory pathway component PulF